MSYKWVRRPDFRRKIRYLTFWVIGNQIFMHIQPKITYSLNRRLHLKYLHIKNTIESKICWKSCIQIKCKILRLNTSSIRFLFFLFTGQIVHMCIFSVAENCHLICHLVSFIYKKSQPDSMTKWHGTHFSFSWKKSNSSVIKFTYNTVYYRFNANLVPFNSRNKKYWQGKVNPLNQMSRSNLINIRNQKMCTHKKTEKRHT